jgi:hypothetical protein
MRIKDMDRIAFTVTEQDIVEMNRIVLDRDKEEALAFLEKKVLSQLDKKQRKQMDVDGKSHL